MLHLQRSLCVESLEDRMLLSRAFPPLRPLITLRGPFISGVISANTIQIQIRQTTNRGVPFLTMQGSKVASNFSLASVGSLFISVGTGSNTILLGNGNGFHRTR